MPASLLSILKLAVVATLSSLLLAGCVLPPPAPPPGPPLPPGPIVPAP